MNNEQWNWSSWYDWLESNQYIDDDKWNHKKPHTLHNLPQTYKGNKDFCTVWIQTTENLLTYLRKSFGINVCWSSRYNSHKSTINKRRLEQRTWRIVFIKQSNELMLTSLNTQPITLPCPSTNLHGKQICMYSLDTVHRQFRDTWGQVSASINIYRINEKLRTQRRKLKLQTTMVQNEIYWGK